MMKNLKQPSSDSGERLGQLSPPQPVQAIEFTLDGEIGVYRQQGIKRSVPLAVEPLKELPNTFKTKHQAALLVIHNSIEHIKTNLPKRSVPLTRDECIVMGLSKKMLKKLEDFGLIRNRLLKLVNSNRNLKHSKAVVYPTVQGRAYFREKWGSTHVEKK